MTPRACSAPARRRFLFPEDASSEPKNCCARSCASTSNRARLILWLPRRTSAPSTWSIPGAAVIDLNAAFADQHRSGILSEQLTVNSLVETLGVNVPGIQRVNILVEGQPRDTLAGHADLSDSFDVRTIEQVSSP
jgi:hypothetical protein